MELQTMPLRFRVWDKDQKCWLTTVDDDGIDHVEMGIRDVGELIDWAGEDNIVVSQDTGLEDRDNNHIFTGDIIRLVDTGADGFDGDGDLGAVAFQDGQINLIDKNGEFVYRLYDLDPEALCKVGNIWQNSEMLKN